MLALLHLVGFGPHLDTETPFDPAESTTLTGGSETGKSTCIDGVCFVFWECGADGKPVDVRQIRDGDGSMYADVVTAKETTLWRKMTSARSMSRGMIAPDGTQTSFQTADQMASKLGTIASYKDVGRLIVAPLQWVPLLQAELGRPFRDLVQSVLPAGDLRGTVAAMLEEGGFALHASDNLDIKGALAQQAAANSNRDVLRGRLQAAESRVSTLAGEVPAGPDEATMATAEAVLTATAAWSAYDARVGAAGADIARHEAALAAHQRLVVARDEWRQRFAELGDRPVVDAAAKQAHDQKLVKATGNELAAQKAVRAADDAIAAATRARDTAQAKIGKLKGAADTCPTCKRPGWTEASELLTACQDELVVANAQLAEAETAKATARYALQTAEMALSVVRAAGEGFAAPAVAAAGWDAAKRALGVEPAVGLLPLRPAGATVPEPTVARPSGEEHRAAMATRDEARTARSMADRVRSDSTAAADALTSTRKLVEAAETECKRVVVLVDAARRAPTEIARQQAEALGEMGCVSLRFPPKENRQTPEVEVLIDGRPWYLASRGRLVYADALLRCALRRSAAAQLSPAFAKLPLFVDDVQAWSGDWDGIDGPCVYLVTQPGELESSAAADGAA